MSQGQNEYSTARARNAFLNRETERAWKAGNEGTSEQHEETANRDGDRDTGDNLYAAARPRIPWSPPGCRVYYDRIEEKLMSPVSADVVKHVEVIKCAFAQRIRWRCFGLVE